MSLAAVDVVFGRDDASRASFALLLWNFGGISVSFVLPDNAD